MRGRGPDIEAFVLANREELLALATLVALIGLFSGGWLYAHPETSIEERSTDQMTVQLNVSTAATVTGATPLYETGEDVRNLPLYLRESMPENRLRATVAFTDANRTTLTQRVYVRYSARRSDEEFWSDRTMLVKKRVTVANGSYTTSATLDVSRVAKRLREIRRAVGRQATVTATVVVETSYQTGEYDGTLSTALPLSFSDRTYAVGEGAGGTEQSHAKRETVERTRRSSVTWLLLLLGLCGLVGTGGIVVTDRRFGDEFEAWEFSLREYDDWISQGTIDDVTASTHMEVEALVDLVDVAIESDSRVIYDSRRKGAVVVANDVAYHWTAPGVRPLDPELSRPD